ncbi:hypothetical protein I3760_04G117100 [Carya illinoinensis]|nr:hypothetical protein I3760_04G117100 [Carya illinoinensis]
MQFVHSPSKNQSSRLINIIVTSCSVCLLYLLVSIFLSGSSKIVPTYSPSGDISAPTSLEHIVFGIASSKKSWPKRKEYVRLWWKPLQTRGCVFIESPLPDDDKNVSRKDSTSLPPLCISQDTSKFRYTCKNGLRSAIRVARVVSETVALNHSDVRWYVFGDDDTIFFPENLVKTLSKYDHGLWYYIGTQSESVQQNMAFGFRMAFGGAGLAISSPLARVLAKVFDSCIERYPHLYGSDSRIYSCLAELGVGLTHEPGFHQVDIRGDMFGLLAAHPVTPLVSLHHLDHLRPIFPNMTTTEAITHLFEAVNVDSQRILQQTICYDKWFSWTISVSWGYAVQIFPNHMFLPDVLHAQETFWQWKNGNLPGGIYMFNTRKLHPDPCDRPTIFFLDTISSNWDGISSIYKKLFVNCSNDVGSPRKLQEIRVFSHKLDLHVKRLQAPRRHCCDVLRSSKSEVMEIGIRECKEEELIHMH